MFGRKAKKIESLEMELGRKQQLADKYWNLFQEEGKQTKIRVEQVEARLNAINKALADENRDLVRQLELLRALLSQIQITVKLPARKTNG